MSFQTSSIGYEVQKSLFTLGFSSVLTDIRSSYLIKPPLNTSEIEFRQAEFRGILTAVSIAEVARKITYLGLLILFKTDPTLASMISIIVCSVTKESVYEIGPYKQRFNLLIAYFIHIACTNMAIRFIENYQ
jgi:hypothetical protein